jgi:hypothetical protein
VVGILGRMTAGAPPSARSLRPSRLPNTSLQLTGPAAEKRLIRKRMWLARQLSSRPLCRILLPLRLL